MFSKRIDQPENIKLNIWLIRILAYEYLHILGKWV